MRIKLTSIFSLVLLIIICSMYIANAENFDDEYFYPENPPASFNGFLNDYGSDTDGDGLYNFLVIEFGVNVTIAGNYSASVYLENNSGGIPWGHRSWDKINIGYLNFGNQTVMINFSGWKIHKNKLNGPYTVGLELFNESSSGLPIDGITTRPNVTFAYNYTDFQIPNGRFSNVFLDYPADIDGDGVYDTLILEIGVDIQTNGEYICEGTLYDSNGNGILVERNSTYFTIGNNSISLFFDGENIKYAGVDGVYALRYLSLYNNEEQIDFILDAYNTSAYNHINLQPLPTTENNGNKSTPGFELIFIFVAIALVLFWQRKRI